MVVPAEVLVMGGIEGHIIGGPSGWSWEGQDPD